MNLNNVRDDRLAVHILEGKRAIGKLEQSCQIVPDTWQAALAELRAEMAHRRNVKEIASLIRSTSKSRWLGTP
ncbi:MAG: hypothetical protein Q8R28_01395 [Dehalococcoidia bacterium]|nr:hypothetical protein [Dehalococcoidia bacterium]